MRCPTTFCPPLHCTALPCFGQMHYCWSCCTFNLFCKRVFFIMVSQSALHPHPASLFDHYGVFLTPSQCLAPRLALGGTASLCLTPAVPLLNWRQARSTWLSCRHPLLTSLQLLHPERVVSIAHSRGCIKARGCLTGRPEGDQFMGTKASWCCGSPQVHLASLCTHSEGLLLQCLCFTHMLVMMTKERLYHAPLVVQMHQYPFSYRFRYQYHGGVLDVLIKY